MAYSLTINNNKTSTGPNHDLGWKEMILAMWHGSIKKQHWTHTNVNFPDIVRTSNLGLHTVRHTHPASEPATSWILKGAASAQPTLQRS